MTIIGLDPTSRVADHGDRSLAPRPASLSGQVLGVVCNGLGNSEVFMDALVEDLRARAEFADVIKIVKDSVSVPPNPDQWRLLLERSTVAIVGFGGCGSCSARAMRDAIELEWAGIPAVYIGHEALESSARAISRLCGQPSYPQVLASMQPPPAAWPDDDCRALATELAPAVHAGMLDQVPAFA